MHSTEACCQGEEDKSIGLTPNAKRKSVLALSLRCLPFDTQHSRLQSQATPPIEDIERARQQGSISPEPASLLQVDHDNEEEPSTPQMGPVLSKDETSKVKAIRHKVQNMTTTEGVLPQDMHPVDRPPSPLAEAREATASVENDSIELGESAAHGGVSTANEDVTMPLACSEEATLIEEEARTPPSNAPSPSTPKSVSCAPFELRKTLTRECL
jgi:hypothetical protein